MHLAGGRRLLLGAGVLALLGAGWACLITNCPRGGKRSGAVGRSAECSPCGPGGEGLCVGPGICCSPQFGCVLAAGGRGGCQHAAELSRCAPPASVLAAAAAAAVPLDAPCGADLTPDGSAPGRCAAHSVCCTHDSCRLDTACQPREDNEIGTGFDNDAMLTSLRRLIASNASN